MSFRFLASYRFVPHGRGEQVIPRLYFRSSGRPFLLHLPWLSQLLPTQHRFSISMPSIVASRWADIQVRWTSEARIYGVMVKRVDVLHTRCPSSPDVALLLPCTSDDLSTNTELFPTVRSPYVLPVICPQMLIRLQQSVPPDVTLVM